MLRASGIIFLLVNFCFTTLAKTFPDIKGKSGWEDSIPASNDSLAGSAIISPMPLTAEYEADDSRKADFLPGFADALSNLGTYFMDQGDLETSYNYYRNYQKLAFQLNDSLLMAEACANLAVVHRYQGLMKEAEEEYAKAIEISRLQKNKVFKAKTYSQLGTLMFVQDRFEEAISCFRRSLELTDEANKVEQAALLHNIGVVLKAQKNYPLSLSYLKESLEILEHTPHSGDISSVMIHIGEIQQGFNKNDLAGLYYHKALRAALHTQNIDKIVSSYFHLSELNAKEKNFKLAYDYGSLYAAYKDTLASRGMLANQEMISKRLEFERREKLVAQLIQEKELELLSKDYQLSKVALARKNEMIWFGSAGFLLIAVVALVFIKNYNLRKKKNLELEQAHFQACSHNFLLQDLNSKLKDSEKQLKELNDTKDKFFSIISHDLRGPLNTLTGFVSILKKSISYFSQEELDSFSGQMERTLQGVTSLLDNLFQWASSQTGLMKFSSEEFALRKLADETCNLLTATAELKEISLSCHIPQELWVNGDIQMMRLLIRNMVSNAIKFTNRGGYVKVNAWVRDNDVFLTIEDNGMGISEENQRKLLRSSQTFSYKGTENEKGSGLGLILCKEFVHMHGGSLNLQSVLDQGTTFIVSFPNRAVKRVVEGSLSI